MKTKTKIIISLLICAAAFIFGIGAGSIYIQPKDVLEILMHEFFSAPISPDISDTSISIVWKLRLPRTIIAFIVGGALSVSGTVMQSVLKNPLASSYTLGVSSGASVGAAAVIVTGFTIPLLHMFTLPFVGLLCGLLTVYISVKFASRMDANMENNTIILVGMVFSLFINAILTLIIAVAREHIAQLTYWQMGSFSSKDWSVIIILLPVVIAGVSVLMRYSQELDIMTFGEDQAFTMGIDVPKLKWLLLGAAAALTGSAISFVGVIGFIDLIAPHVVRRIFGSSHKIVIPMSMVFGGSFMVICDLAARTLASPSELPVGSITALIGAPFFAYIYFSKRRDK